MVSRHEIGTFVWKDHNRRAALRIFANQTSMVTIDDLCGQASQFHVYICTASLAQVWNCAKDRWYSWCLGECERLPVPVPDLPAGELLQPPWRVTVCWWHRREIVICYLDYQYLIWKQISTIYTYLNLIWVTKNRIKYCIFCIHFPHFCIWKALCGHLRSPGSGSSTDLHQDCRACSISNFLPLNAFWYMGLSEDTATIYS